MEKLTGLLTRCLRYRNPTSCRVLPSCIGYLNTTLIQSRDAGHNKWNNIRHIKGAKDKIKSDVSSTAANRIRLAVRDGGANIKMNSKLKKAVEFASDNKVPSKTIQTMIEKAVAAKETFAQTRIEAKGPNGSLLIFDISSDCVRRTRNEVSRIVARRMGGSLMDAGGTMNFFEEKGVIMAAASDFSKQVSLVEAEDIAIMVEAEDVQLADNSETDQVCFEITCEPETIYTVVKGLSDTELRVIDYNVLPIPNDLVELSEEDKTAVDSTIEVIRGLTGSSLDNVYDNINW